MIRADEKIYGLVAQPAYAIKENDSIRKGIHNSKVFAAIYKNSRYEDLIIFVSYNLTMTNRKKSVSLTVAVAAIGYFVDVYDLQLFNIISKASLQGIGITDPEVIERYDYLLLLWQLGGMLAGGIFWGILGDKLGRKSILFGSILMYSFANLFNAFVMNLDQYAIIRLMAGFGLAGELGAAITLISEVMHKEKRGYGTMIIVTMGALGAVAAASLSKMNLEWVGLANWQMSYIIGGVLGLFLLLLRMGTFESTMFEDVKTSAVSKGNFFMLFRKRETFLRYLACIMVGLPVWFCVGILIKFCERIASTNGVEGPVTVGDAIMYSFIGLSFGDLVSGWLSQFFRNRKKVILGYLLSTLLLLFIYLFIQGISNSLFYFLCFLIGTATGYWALFVSVAAEHFGTNIRATVTTTAPNFVRGLVIPMTFLYKWTETQIGNIYAALSIGILILGISLWSLHTLKETFGKDLNYIEH